jgi:hypothetical protein
LNLFVDFISLVFQALDLKPNYVRAWANMGISYANQVFTSASLFTTPLLVPSLAFVRQ